MSPLLHSGTRYLLKPIVLSNVALSVFVGIRFCGENDSFECILNHDGYCSYQYIRFWILHNNITQLFSLINSTKKSKKINIMILRVLIESLYILMVV